MSRIWYGIVLLSVAATCNAQFPGAPLPAGQPIGGEFQSKVVDPKAVVIPLKPGTPVSEVLTALTDKGFRIKWKPEHVQPNMKLLEKPRSTRVDNLLNEILAPWGMRADADLLKGGYLVKQKKKPKEFAVEQTSPPPEAAISGQAPPK
jgi:hypothetical protein